VTQKISFFPRPFHQLQSGINCTVMDATVALIAGASVTAITLDTTSSVIGTTHEPELVRVEPYV
jgi:hypothetical protein